ncbi:MAG: VOC family protein [Oceanicaulis sp.]
MTFRLFGVFLLAGLAAAAPACAQSPDPAPERFLAETGRGWQEAVVSVRDLAPIGDFLVEVAGYEVMETGGLDSAWLEAWDLPDGAGGAYILLRSPGKDVGWVRLVRFTGVSQELIRPGAQAWDQGGLFSLMVRSEEAQHVADAAHARGWSVFNQPQVFEFGPLTIENVVVRLPDGVNLAVYSRVSPPVDGWDDLAGFSYPFNTMAMVHDIEAERRFFEDGLGFSAFWEGDYIDAAPADTNFAMPDNLADDIPRRTAILQQREGEDGRVELMHFVGLDGADFSERARPPNLGLLAVRLPVDDLEASLARLAALEAAPAAGPVTLGLSPYGEISWAAVRSPGGVVVELFEQP